MSILLKQSTTVTLKMGPFLDATDGVTEETAITPAVEVSKAGAAFAARNSATAVAHDAEGWYDVELDGTDTNTLGRLVAKAHDSATHLPVWHEFTVVPAHVYDGLVAGSDNLQVDTVQIGGTTQTANDVGGDVDAILVDTNSLNDTKIPDTISLANINAEVDTAIVTYGLDHLVSAAVAGTDIANNSIIAKIVSASATADWDDFVNTTDSLQALRDWIGNGSNLTESAGTGDQLTAIPWNASWDAEVQSEVNDALVAIGLDHLLSASVAGTDVTDNSIIAYLVSSGATADWDTFVNTTDALQAIRDHVGDGTNLTEAGGTGDHLTAIPETAANVTSISGDSTAADRLESLMDGLIVAQVNDASATTTTFIADGFTEATDDHFNGRLITFITGNLTGQQTDITDYTGSSQTFTVTALTSAPANNDFFVIH